ncbi:regulatory LuxR family protein [Actinocorallia herbida]|uniref:Regulatory LuxR family protein n=1 Tax=Actinocorallia herbida TaxID=58109 RepID=A0A3N1CVP6_9ACTN|nr:AAA family ATPase [Actinocorallia herbida]ROO85370.1 regulatory LuxR family protein [Actinocorallia herbida]
MQSVEEGSLCEPRLRGRDREVAHLAGLIKRLCEGNGGVLLVEGGPGVGKSRLAREARALAESTGVRVLAGTGERDHQIIPFGALLQALVSDGRPVVDAGVLRTLSEAADQRFWLFQAVQDQLRRAAQDRPLLIVIDDLQWCDAGTLLALRTLADRLTGQPVLWLATVRTGSPDADVRATVAKLTYSGARTLRLDPLPDDEVALIARDLLAAEPDADILALLRQAEGRPLQVTETLRGLVGEGAVTRSDAVAHLTGRHSPIHSYGSAQRLLGHLSPLAREVLQLASVLGRDLEADRLADLSGRTIAELVAALQEAVDADLVRPTDPLTFRHDLVREAIRGTVPVSLRRALRKQAADLSLARGAALSQVALAMAETAEPGDAEAAALLRRALADLSEGSPEAAVPIALQAVKLAPEGSAERADAVADALPLLARTGRAGEGLALAESVLEGALPVAVEARVRLGAAMAALRGSSAEALRHSRAGARLDGAPDEPRAQLTALHCLTTLLTGDDGAAELLLAPAGESVARAGSDPAVALLRTADSLLRAFRLDFTEAESLAAAAVAAAPDSSALFFPAVWAAALHGITGRVDDGLRAADEGVAAAQRPGHGQGLDLWRAVRARLLFTTGRLAEARTEAEAALALAEESGSGEAVAFEALAVIGRVAALTGDHAAAELAATRLSDGAGPLRRAGARSAALLAAPDRACALLEEAATTCGPPTASGFPADPADDPHLVRALLDGGLRDHAAALVAEAELRAGLNPGVPYFAAIAAHTRGLLDGEADAVLRAVGILDGLPCPLPLAAAAEDAGRLLLESDQAAAVQHLTRAESGYTRTGAEHAAAEVRRRLSAAGHRRRRTRRRAERGWGALTPAERRVAALVAEGATNRQAAERLFLSPATVGTHVMHIFHKIGVNSRVELARAYLERDGTVD